MLEIIHLEKSFDTNRAVNDISFKVQPGEIFGLVGPNGAGKTTTMRMILDIIRPDEGEVLVNGLPRTKVNRSTFGYLPEERGLYQRAKVLDLLIYFGLLNHLTKHRAGVEAIRLLDKFGLVEYTLRRVSELSKGMQQKIQFIAASMHDPDIMILDEPYAGLDPVNQMVLRDMIQQFKEEGKVIVLSSHQMSEIEKVSDNICLINQGRVILDGSMSEIKQKFTENAYYIEAEHDLSLLHDLKAINIIEEHNRSAKFSIKNNSKQAKDVLHDLMTRVKVIKFYRIEPSLNDIFIKLVQKEKTVK